jgi:hypothetical protein
MTSFGTSSDEKTIGTATEALMSKLSAIQRGYFHDDFLPHFVGSRPGQKKPPIINRGYFARVECINKVIYEFDTLCKSSGSIESQVLILGGGYDTLSLNLLKDAREDVTVFEIDFPEVINRKSSIILSNSHLLAAVRPPIDSEVVDSADALTSSATTSSSVSGVIKLGNLLLIAADLRDSARVLELLDSASFDGSKPTLIVSECVLVYMSKDDSLRLVQRYQS